MKIDESGNQILFNKIGGHGDQLGSAICKTSDGNFLLLGSSNASGNRGQDVYLVKISPEGKKLWAKTFGGVNDDYGVDVLELNNGNYFVLANTNSFGKGDLDIWMLWIDANGNLIREATNGAVGMDGAAETIELPNGGLLNFCYTRNYGATSRDFYLLRTDKNGDSLWAKRYGGNDYEESQNINITPEGDVLLVGHSASSDPFHDMYVLKIATDGSVIWERNFGGVMHDGGQCQLISSNGNYVFVARSMSFGSGDRNAYVVNTNTKGDVISKEVIGGSGNDRIDDIIEFDGYYYLVGHSNSSGAGLDDVWIVKKKI